MKNLLRMTAALLLLLALALPAQGFAQGRYDAGRKISYTQADYDLALSFQTDGYGELTVADFDRSVLDWEDEDAYHRNEASLRRIFASLADDDPNAGFILGTLRNAWDACEVRHYNACGRATAPWHNGFASSETYGDIFGDQVLLRGAYVEFCFDYIAADERSLTVARRDALLSEAGRGLEAFLQRQDAAALRDTASMKKKLEAELKRILSDLDDAISWGGGWNLSYYLEDPYAYETDIADTNWKAGYTQGQYDRMMAALKPAGYEDMSVADYDRLVHAVFDGDDGWDDAYMIYEMASANLSEHDPNADFLRTTVPMALREYEARAVEVYSGRENNPTQNEWISTYIEEDVFGDDVVVGEVMADYTFSYRLLDADRLTVRERDAFLKAVKEGAKEFLEGALKTEGQATKAAFKAGLEAAGRAASTDAIRFVDCTVDTFEIAR